jgi:hypothetical protein
MAEKKMGLSLARGPQFPKIITRSRVNRTADINFLALQSKLFDVSHTPQCWNDFFWCGYFHNSKFWRHAKFERPPPCRVHSHQRQRKKLCSRQPQKHSCSCGNNVPMLHYNGKNIVSAGDVISTLHQIGFRVGFTFPPSPPRGLVAGASVILNILGCCPWSFEMCQYLTSIWALLGTICYICALGTSNKEHDH